MFGFWALVLLIVMSVLAGPKQALDYADSRQFTEPLFVFTIMVIAASKPILEAVTELVLRVACALPIQANGR